MAEAGWFVVVVDIQDKPSIIYFPDGCTEPLQSFLGEPVYKTKFKSLYAPAFVQGQYGIQTGTQSNIINIQDNAYISFIAILYKFVHVYGSDCLRGIRSGSEF